jgi:hypothetical protein
MVFCITMYSDTCRSDTCASDQYQNRDAKRKSEKSRVDSPSCLRVRKLEDGIRTGPLTLESANYSPNTSLNAQQS